MPVRRPLIGLSLEPARDFLRAALPLFEGGVVDVLEWSFDLVANPSGGVPPPIDELLRTYSDAGRLLCHGVTFSLLTAETLPHHEQWYRALDAEFRSRRYRHLSEHFGFMVAGGFHEGAPLPVPRSPELVRLARARLVRMREIAGVPVGLENLAFAFRADDVMRHGELLDELLSPVDGFVLPDLHNMYCQSVNFNVPLSALLDSYPCDRVRELPLAGGSWYQVPDDGDKRVRRDTHDGDVPDAVLEFVPEVLERCPNVEAVVFERMGGTIRSEEEAASFRRQYLDLRTRLEGADGD